MITEDQLKKLEAFVKKESISEKDQLLLFSNHLLRNIKNYENIDLTSKRLGSIFVKDYNNFYEIKNLLEYNKESISLEVGKIVHNLIYLYNQIQLEEEKQYGRKPN